YSFLRSGLSVRKICGLAKKNGYPAVALSDYETMSGYPELTHLLQKEPLKPIYGLDVQIDGVLLSLYLRNEAGYKNLILINLEASKGKLSKDFLLEHQEGLTIILPSEYSPLRNLYQSKNPLEDCAKWLFDFSKGFSSFYLGIPYLPTETAFPFFLRKFAEKYPYETLAFPHFLYQKESDAIVLDIVSAISSDSRLEEKEKSGSNYFLPPEVLGSAFSEKELAKSKQIADTVSFQFLQKRGGLLHFPNDLGLSNEDYLRKLANEGLREKLPNADERYQKRLDYELDIINKMGYADYFLIVGDYVHFAKTHDISVGPGRGSGAGSLVSYALGIVTPDPINHDLLFERFLNPERQSMPDIDVDFADVKRDQVVLYLQRKYGHDHVSHIATMQTIGARQSIRDVGRVYGYEQREIDLLAKTIRGFNPTLRDEYKNNKRFRDLIDSDPYYLGIIQLAAKIEGLPRQSGLHAAGIVLNDSPLQSAIPVKDDPAYGLVCSYEMNYLEEQGFLKMDLLGLRNLSIVDQCLALIKDELGVSLDYQTLPYNDPKAIQLIASGKTMGLFQLESAGMKKTIRQIEPNCFEDVVAAIALFRPGPMDNIPHFARRKKGLEKVSYLCKEMEQYLSSTYGILVYQEQVMQIVRAMAGLSYAQADNFRRAISKKDAEKLRSLEATFVEGAQKQGHPLKLAQQVYRLIYEFADYGFNKSHAVSYGYLACQMAYLKANYPKQFFAAILDQTTTKDPKFGEMLSEMKALHLALSLPSVNESLNFFKTSGDSLLFPLSGIKGIQNSFCLDLIEERERNGVYPDLFDFARRMKPYGLTLPLLIKLIDAGALDCLDQEGNRSRLRASGASAIQYAEMFVGNDGQQTLFELEIPKPILVDVPNRPAENLLSEKEALGVMISGSPLTLHQDGLRNQDYLPLAEVPDANGSLWTAGAVKSLRTITAKNKRTMAFLIVYDDIAELEITVFSDEYDSYFPLLQKDNVLLLKVHSDERRENTYILEEAKEVR
ncbi:MAG: DNA polymerase III subunit alpha, partial [Bacilli bacterium]|nr:DNA polymerase III subunit alpha [Bacilli bacterium]